MINSSYFQETNVFFSVNTNNELKSRKLEKTADSDCLRQIKPVGPI